MSWCPNLNSMRASTQTCRQTTKQRLQSDALFKTCRASITSAKCLSSQTSYFDILGVGDSASQQQIKAGFRSKSKLLHPDVNKEPGASRDFMALLRAYYVLSSPELRAEYEAQLGLPSARGRDPRFARFERWRREVLPDLRQQLDVWSTCVEGFIAAWRGAVDLREGALVRLQDTCVTAFTQLRTASVTAGDIASCNNLTQQHQQLLAAAQDALGSMRREIEGIVSDSADGTARVEREVEKRAQQLFGRYPAYPDIVWWDVWEEMSGTWIEESEKEAQRCTETVSRWSARVLELQEQLDAAAVGAGVYGSCSGAGAGRFHEA